MRQIKIYMVIIALGRYPFGCVPPVEPPGYRTYFTVTNESGVPLRVEAYRTANPSFRFGDILLDEDRSTSRGFFLRRWREDIFYFSNFFAGLDRLPSDSLRVIYNDGEKVAVFKSDSFDNPNKDPRNPFSFFPGVSFSDTVVFQTFTFTEEDYKNAKPL